jgi:TrmH family RNA methyltransferase
MTGSTGAGSIISSRRHPLVIRLRKIARRPSLARRFGLFLLDGVHLFEEALASSHPPETILITPGLRRSPAGRSLVTRMKKRAWPIQETTDDLLETIAATDTPQGVLGLFHRPTGEPHRHLPRPDAPTIGEPPKTNSELRALVLAGVQDPVNLGVLARAAWVFGCHGLVTLEKTVDPFHPRALRASSGTLLRLNVAAGVSHDDLRSWIDADRILLVELVPHQGTPLSAFSAQGHPCAILLGSEGRGIPRELADICREHRSISMIEGADSLGVAAAGTIALYVITRRLADEGGARTHAAE